MASLVSNFQAELISGGSTVCSLLRTAKLISAKLGLADIAEWIGFELTGYPEGSEVPAYRLIRGGDLQVWHPYRGGWQKGGHLDKSFPIMQSMSEVEVLAKSESVVISIAQANNFAMRSTTGADVSGWPQQIEISTVAVNGIVDAVRDRLLDWSIELEKRGIQGTEMTFSDDERKSAQSQTFHIQHMTGVIGNVTGSEVTIYDYSSIHQALRQANVPQEERNELENLMDELKSAKPDERPTLIERGKKWIVKNEEFLGASAAIVRKAIGIE